MLSRTALPDSRAAQTRRSRSTVDLNRRLRRLAFQADSSASTSPGLFVFPAVGWIREERFRTADSQSVNRPLGQSASRSQHAKTMADSVASPSITHPPWPEPLFSSSSSLRIARVLCDSIGAARTGRRLAHSTSRSACAQMTSTQATARRRGPNILVARGSGEPQPGFLRCQSSVPCGFASRAHPSLPLPSSFPGSSAYWLGRSWVRGFFPGL